MIEPRIINALRPFFGSRIYPDTAPANPRFPFVCYQQVGGTPTPTFCGSPRKINARIQFWVWSETREEANRLMREIETALTQSPLLGVSQGALVARFDEPTKRYGAQQDFSFWFDIQSPSGS